MNAPRTHRPYRHDRPSNGLDRLRPQSHKRGYGSRWARVRASHLQHEPLCRTCLAGGRTTAASMVDHIIPIASGGDRFASDNLQSLCRACHAAKTGRESHARRHRQVKATQYLRNVSVTEDKPIESIRNVLTTGKGA